VGGGSSGQTNIVEASEDLSHWVGISTNVFNASTCPTCPYIDVTDKDAPQHRLRFYRAYILQ